MAHPEPPSYLDNLDSDLPVYDELPTQSAVHNSEPRPFEYQIKDSNGWWAMLTVKGDGRLSNATEPTILQGTNVTGSVKLALRKAEPIQAIHITVRGEVLGGTPAESTGVPIVFLKVKKALWSSSEGDTNEPSKTESASGLPLQGDYHWPFSIELPAEITNNNKSYRLPKSFGTGIGYFTLQYVVELHIVRPALHLGRDEKLPVIFNYFPLSKPAAPSPLRALAYQENSPLLGPDADPEGWNTKSFIISGEIFSTRKVDNILVKLSLAKPLSYTRSVSIPCALTIESTDQEVVDLLSKPEAPMIYLECTTQQNPQQYRTTMEPCAKASLWTPPGGERGQLMGEIHLKPTLYPSTNFAAYGYRVVYTVALFPFQAIGFKQTGDIEPVEGSRQVVEICTQYAPGPRPKTYSPVPGPGEGRSDVIDSYYRLRAATTMEVASEEPLWE